MPETLLLADDSVTIRRVIELTFADESIAVVSVSSGRDAISSIEASPPDIVLADAGMPDVSGYDIASFVKGRPELRHIPVILLAGAFEPLDEARSRKSGADGVLVKPFEPQMVVARVRELLSQPAAMPAATAPAPPPASADFADDLRQLDSEKGGVGDEGQDFGDWDLPLRPGEISGSPFDQLGSASDAVATPAPEPVVPPMPPPIAFAPKPAPPAMPPSVPPVSAPAPAPEPSPREHREPATASAEATAARPSPGMAPPPLADAFTSLLAEEEGRPHAPLGGPIAGAAPAALTEAQMDLIVDRVLARLGAGVRGSVIDLAERLVKAEIDRLKALR